MCCVIKTFFWKINCQNKQKTKNKNKNKQQNKNKKTKNKKKKKQKKKTLKNDTEILVGQAVFKLWIETVKVMFWSIIQERLVLLKF